MWSEKQRNGLVQWRMGHLAPCLSLSAQILHKYCWWWADNFAQSRRSVLPAYAAKENISTTSKYYAAFSWGRSSSRRLSTRPRPRTHRGASCWEQLGWVALSRRTSLRTVHGVSAEHSTWIFASIKAKKISLNLASRQEANRVELFKKLNPFVPGMQNAKIRQLIVSCLLRVSIVKRPVCLDAHYIVSVRD